jgi:hypothetical protein
MIILAGLTWVDSIWLRKPAETLLSNHSPNKPENDASIVHIVLGLDGFSGVGLILAGSRWYALVLGV